MTAGTVVVGVREGGGDAAAFVAVGRAVAVVSRWVTPGVGDGEGVGVAAAIVCPCCACRVDSDVVKVGTARPVVTGLLVSSGVEPPQAHSRKTQTLNHKR
jgi:hypothetical protein